ncbi:cell division protein FtsQ [Phenylobacterium hankyongense]|uniref:Cell division protein FtsQ n=1 Tax=Phenylobacterium hankyongense TaxID=1813876 RepID=A0A328B2D3_9CAUL|nr:cell division protein FtsQ/DivIB [Phenylobacterium hankyongense]RAK60601.1 cell division protein FtsQ [Phenylobacterium hankyongense]
MPAALRGGPRVPASPRGKAPPSPTRQRAAPPRPGAPAGGRPPAPHGPGLSPKNALIVAAGVLVLALIVGLGTGHRGERLVQAAGSSIDGRFGQAGFRLRAVHVEGASPMATADIVRAAAVYKDQPLLGLDLEALRKRVEQVGWVKEARVVRLLPDTLVVAVVERRQLAVWQHAGHSVVIDEHGQVIPEADPGRFPTLPLIVGEGGAVAAPAILPILAQRPRLMERMDAIVRVDDRRWDLRMKDGSLIQLPAVGEEEALMQLEQLDQRSRILELGFERIDLRNPDVVAVRPRQSGPPGQLVAAGA